MVADSLAVGATWYKLWSNRSEGILGRPSLADVFLRDGEHSSYDDPTCVLNSRIHRHNLLHVWPILFSMTNDNEGVT